MPTAKEEDGLVEVTIRKADLVSDGAEVCNSYYPKGAVVRVTPEQAEALRDRDYAD